VPPKLKPLCGLHWGRNITKFLNSLDTQPKTLFPISAKTVDSPATISKYYAKLPQVVLRKFVEHKPVIPNYPIWLAGTVNLAPLHARPAA